MSMSTGGGSGGLQSEINVTPMVDIMLVLLIIFMLTAHMIAKQAIVVDLPQAANSSKAPPTTVVRAATCRRLPC